MLPHRSSERIEVVGIAWERYVPLRVHERPRERELVGHSRRCVTHDVIRRAAHNQCRRRDRSRAHWTSPPPFRSHWTEQNRAADEAAAAVSVAQERCDNGAHGEADETIYRAAKQLELLLQVV